MAQPKITGLATPGDLDLGDVQEEIPTLQKPSSSFNLPGQDSSKTISIDLLGMVRTIQITGFIEKDTIAELKTWQETFYTYMKGTDGRQQSDSNDYGYSYVSDYLGTINVKIIFFAAPIKAGQKPETTYTLRLEESDTAV
ncbi:hypothetical protein KAR91_44545 [Candidatus Pacearchaeota archaeon]|nr:hypothetical protein [Candidatus Pacearchaeota archaeon]